MKQVCVVGVLLCFASLSSAADFPLSPAFKNLQHPQRQAVITPRGRPPAAPARSDVLSVIHNQSSVRNQSRRGTCSIFSATAALEGLLVRAGHASPGLDLSEEWLQYLTTQAQPGEGSSSADNFMLLRQWGQPFEKSLPYGGQSWTSKSSGLALRRCGYLKRGDRLRACLTSHRDPDLLNMSDEELLNPNEVYYDPEFVAARKEALSAREAYLSRADARDGIVTTVSKIHQLLAAGIPLTLDIDFFWGAWNYPGSAAKGIFRSQKYWESGTITYPEKGSVDRQYSKRHPESHSVVVVGYDNDVEVTYTMNMRDGKQRKFTRKGVYYIKNSWGTDSWGKNFHINGQSFRGYGMILQDNAHEFGEFYHLDI